MIKPMPLLLTKFLTQTPHSLHELLALTQAQASVHLCRRALERLSSGFPKDDLPAKHMLLMLVLYNHPDFMPYDLMSYETYCTSIHLFEGFSNALRVVFATGRRPRITAARELYPALREWWDPMAEFAAARLLELRAADRSTKMAIANLLCEEEAEIQPFKQSCHRFDAHQHQMMQQFGDRMLELRITTQTLLQGDKEEFFQHMPTLLNAERVNARRRIQEARILVNQLAKHQCVIAIEDEPVLHEWDPVDIRPATGNDPKTMDTYLAKAITKDMEYDYKPSEYVFTTAGVFELDSVFPQFSEGRLVSRFELCQHGFALVSTKYAPYMVITHGGRDTINEIRSYNKKIIIHNHPGDNANPTGFAIVEIKCCSSCGKPAHLKCLNCWNTHRLCVRFCSAQCKNRDSHAAICGHAPA
jgi:hypothetical protein